MILPSTYVLFGLFIIVSVIELIAAFNEQEGLRKIMKPFSLFFLALAAFITLPSHPLIYIGAFLGMIGDIFLIFIKDRKLFILGTIAFLFGHLCYITEILFFIIGPSQIDWWFYVVVLFSILLIVLGAYPTSKKITQSRYVALLGNLYLSILVLVTVASLIATLNGYVNYLVLGVIGGISFLVSDLILTKATFIKDFKRRDYYIMLFYLLGQGFIVCGLVLTQLF